MNLINLTIKQAHDGLKKKEFSSKELTLAYLEQIKKTNKDINAFLSVFEDSAVFQAEKADEKIASGNFSELTGIPYAVKDAILVEGEKCTTASKILENYVSPYDATVIKKLKEQQSVILGKTNTDEFTMGASTENSAFGVTKNPYDETRVAGGSSGGSAASVAANEALVALGADTGGSIRLPAAFCGVVGLKPTYGTVSRHGLIAMASSLDQIGPIAKTAEDAEAVFEAICGRDAFDATSLAYQYESLYDFDVKNLRIGVAKEFFGEGLMPQIAEFVKAAIYKLEQAGATVQEISLPHAKYALAAYYIINTSEVSANLARFDGIRYGKSVSRGQNLLDIYLQSRGEYLGAEVKRRIMLGTFARMAGYRDACYLQALKVRTKMIEEYKKLFTKYDVLMTPTAPIVAPKFDEIAKLTPLQHYMIDIFTVGPNIAGLPHISVPVGKQNGMPVGALAIADHFKESTLIKLGGALEKTCGAGQCACD